MLAERATAHGEIGIRASIRTWDGAEGIVPNAGLTSERVAKWTLSDTLRRVTLDVGVAYSIDAATRRVSAVSPRRIPRPSRSDEITATSS